MSATTSTSTQRPQAERPKGHKDVFTIVERGEGQKAIFVRVGAAFANRDGSLNVLLDALPVGGRLNIRDPRPEPEGEPDSDQDDNE